MADAPAAGESRGAYLPKVAALTAMTPLSPESRNLIKQLSAAFDALV